MSELATDKFGQTAYQIDGATAQRALPAGSAMLEMERADE
jgi:hypothetical protein